MKKQTQSTTRLEYKLRLLKLIRIIGDLNPKKLDMEVGFCGSVGCIAGWAFQSFASEALKKLAIDKMEVSSVDSIIDEIYHWPTVRHFAKRYLGLSEKMANDLFFPDGVEECYGKPRGLKTRMLSELGTVFNEDRVRGDWYTRSTPYKLVPLDKDKLEEVCQYEAARVS